MRTVDFVYWEEDGAWIGHLHEYPDYWTQGESLADLKEHLRDLYRDLTRLAPHSDHGRLAPIPRHREIGEGLARHIIKILGHGENGGSDPGSA